MVELEADSSFGLQGARWLADVAPHLLSPELRARVDLAKAVAQQRQSIEAEIPNHLLYTKGWPTTMPTPYEAALVSSVRRRISELLDLDAGFLTADSARARYAELLEAKREKERKAALKRRRT